MKVSTPKIDKNILQIYRHLYVNLLSFSKIQDDIRSRSAQIEDLGLLLYIGLHCFSISKYLLGSFHRQMRLKWSGYYNIGGR